MGRAGALVLVTQGLLWWAAVAAAAPLDIVHEPPACVPADRYLRVVAAASPSEQVRAAELQFRADPEGAWYTATMAADGGKWSGLLPRATPALARFEYRISMTGPAGEVSSTPTYGVRVASDPSGCDGLGELSVSTSIVVRVPPGAPVVPPVPAGFDPGGVVAAAQPHGHGAKKALVLLGAAGTAGVLVGVAAAGNSETAAPPPDIPGFAFTGTSPNPGSTILLGRTQLQLFVTMSREPATPLNLDWRAEWRQTGSGPVCVAMDGRFNGAQRPVGLIFTSSILLASSECGTSFEASFAHLTIRVSDRLVWEVTLGLPFRFER
jgi:hypothetical protein